MHKRALQLLFGFILVSLTAYNAWVCTRQSVFAWGGLTTPPDNLWTIAAFIDAYYGFITFYVWVLWKESRAGPRARSRAPARGSRSRCARCSPAGA